MHVSPLTTLLLKPSLFSGIVSGVFAFVLLAVANWSFATKGNPILYAYLYGPEGLATNVETSTNGVSALTASLSSRVLTYEVLVFIAALFVGFTVYTILQSFGKVVNDAVTMYQEVQDAAPHAKAHTSFEVFAKIAIRATAIVGWFFFWMFTLKVLFPAAVVASTLTIAEPANSWYVGLIAFFLLYLALHLHVIFARLLMLRPRVWGGRDEILLALASDHSRRGVQ